MDRRFLCAFALLSAGMARAQVVLGQTDTFPADTMSWQGANPGWVSTGGPGGAGDAFLQLNSTGGSGPASRMAGYNSLQWSGDFTGAGVGAIDVDFENLGQTDLEMRIVFRDLNLTTQWVSNASALLAVGSGWQHFTFVIDPAQFTLTEGSTSFADTLSGVNRMMFRHNPGPPSADVSPIVASLGVDNIHAAPVPEPATLLTIGVGLPLLLRRRMR